MGTRHANAPPTGPTRNMKCEPCIQTRLIKRRCGHGTPLTDCVLTNTMGGYSEQERAQLQLIQWFLSGGFNLSDHLCQDPPPPLCCSESYIDTMKDLHQLPKPALA